MKSTETRPNKKSRFAAKTHKQAAVKYQKGYGGRKRRVRGLWKRGDTFYAQLALPDANGTKKVRRVPLEAATTASASDELHRMIISRDDNHQPAMVENSDKVKCITGVYPVCNIASHPGLKRACGAYGLTVEQLEDELAKHNSIDRLAPLAKAKVPIFHIQGDKDGTVPLDKKSAIIKERYAKLGGSMTLEVVKGQDRNM